MFAEHATISRLRPIHGGLGCWEWHGRCAATGLDGPAPWWVPAMFEPTCEVLYTKTFRLAPDGYISTRGYLTSMKEPWGPSRINIDLLIHLFTQAEFLDEP
jgi:hypothetical protein